MSEPIYTTIHNCGAGAEAMVVGHYINPADITKTLCGREIKGYRWKTRWSRVAWLDDGDCKRCMAKEPKG